MALQRPDTPKQEEHKVPKAIFARLVVASAIVCAVFAYVIYPGKVGPSR